MGARFAKWRAVYQIFDILPSEALIDENAKRLAKYASICQSLDIVPIVEPEVLMDGIHTIERCAEVTEAVHKAVFRELKVLNVELNGIILKPNMILPGKDQQRVYPQEVAKWTINVFKKTVPPEVPTINFLSGGQNDEEATANLNAINQMQPMPWNLSFSYGRALQSAAQKAWLGKKENIKAAQEALFKRAKLNSLATEGKYSEDME